MTYHLKTSRGHLVSHIVTDLVGRVTSLSLAQSPEDALTFDTPSDAAFESDWANRFDWKTSVVEAA